MSDSLIPSFLMSDVSESLWSLTKNEQCEQIAQVAHQKWANEQIARFFERIAHLLIFSQKTSDWLRKAMSEFLALLSGSPARLAHVLPSSPARLAYVLPGSPARLAHVLPGHVGSVLYTHCLGCLLIQAWASSIELKWIKSKRQMSSSSLAFLCLLMASQHCILFVYTNAVEHWKGLRGTMYSRSFCTALTSVRKGQGYRDTVFP